MATLAYHREAIASSNVIDLAERRAAREPRDPQPPAAAARDGRTVQLDDRRDFHDRKISRLRAICNELDALEPLAAKRMRALAA